MQGPDWLLVTTYLLGVTALGVWAGRSVRSPDDYFMGGRRFRNVFMVFFAFGAGDRLRHQTVGEPFVAREGMWIGAKVGVFARAPHGAAPTDAAAFQWFRVGRPGATLPGS